MADAAGGSMVPRHGSVEARPLARSGQLAILPLDLPDPRRPIGVTWLKARPLPPAALRLLTCLQQAVGRLA